MGLDGSSLGEPSSDGYAQEIDYEVTGKTPAVQGPGNKKATVHDNNAAASDPATAGRLIRWNTCEVTAMIIGKIRGLDWFEIGEFIREYCVIPYHARAGSAIKFKYYEISGSRGGARDPQTVLANWYNELKQGPSEDLHEADELLDEKYPEFFGQSQDGDSDEEFEKYKLANPFGYQYKEAWKEFKEKTTKEPSPEPPVNEEDPSFKYPWLTGPYGFPDGTLVCNSEGELTYHRESAAELGIEDEEDAPANETDMEQFLSNPENEAAFLDALNGK